MSDRILIHTPKDIRPQPSGEAIIPLKNPDAEIAPPPRQRHSNHSAMLAGATVMQRHPAATNAAASILAALRVNAASDA